MADYGSVIGWATLSVSGLLLGALLGLSGWFGHGTIARVTALGAGLVLAAASVELAAEAVATHPWSGIAALMGGAATFSAVNAWLAARGARDRKRCAQCLAGPTATVAPTSGAAITIGTAIDAVPEALVLGVTLHSVGVQPALIAAIAVGNLPEAMSASSGMLSTGRSRQWILALWGSVAAATVGLTAAGYATSSLLSEEAVLLLQAFGAGTLLSLVAETMLPEAAEESPKFGGLIAAAGFGLLLLIAELA
ncbi:ZIP family metal transporter [Nocardioides albus]|uniref:ZIP family zinc transporter n=1 Tax=Nocardioides albus TaxID=1841 RepID=A0A7W5A7D5_9ACTN|nr:hypothetical protein [Nocardioides albus]MBB3090840.1 ZIP family zinc transporter [Nocardioides albus]